MSTLISPASNASSTETVRVALAPSAGFCIKSVTSDAGFYTYAPSVPPTTSSPKPSNLLEPTSVSLPKALQIPKGVKVFLNIAWDRNVPAPPTADEAVVRRAMMGEDLDDAAHIGDGAFYVPVVVSEPREALDKTGKPSVVFDCVFSASLKSRCTKDRDFRMYLIELALEHVEEKAHVTLSRQIGTPNISSKGKLDARTVLIPKSLLDRSGASNRPLVQEISVSTSSAPVSSGKAKEDREKLKVVPKSILKNAPSKTGERPLIEDITNLTESGPPSEVTWLSADALDERALSALAQPRWKWLKEGDRLKIEIEVPDLTHKLHSQSTLDIEPRRILLHIPQTHFLDIQLDLSDAQIGKIGSSRVHDAPDSAVSGLDVDALRVKGHNAGETLRLKRQRDLDVDHARAQWRVEEKKLVILV